ncbi:MAG: hypothetical protein ACP5HS_14930 [Anaerolineae bacterium]
MMWIAGLSVLLVVALIVLVIYFIRRRPRSVGKIENKEKQELNKTIRPQAASEILRDEPQEVRRGVQTEVEEPTNE